jgi:hypothetical protein
MRRGVLVQILLLLALGLSILVLASGAGSFRSPGNQVGYSPEQPIAFSHEIHAGQLQIDCQYCHSSAEVSRHAGIPTQDMCMRCHKFVTALQSVLQAENRRAKAENRPPRLIVSDELRKLYDAVGLTGDLKEDPAKQPYPIPWVRVHNLPDHVYFDHRAHVVGAVECQQCHGPVESLKRMRQYSSLHMGWCVNCHRETQGQAANGKPAHASLDCSACHY